MKKFAYAALAALIAVALVAGPASAASVDAQANRITVNGTATVTVTPDIVVVSLGVQQTAEEVSAAQEQVNKKINAVVAALKEAGVEDKDIATSDYSIYQNTTYDPNTGESKFAGYVATTMLAVTVRKVDQAGSYIDMAVKAGANQLNGITFDREDRTQFVDKALELAVKDAARKAGVIATASGKQLGDVVSVDEAEQDYNYPMYSSNVKYSLAEGDASTSLQTGTLDIQVKVVVVYAMN